MKEWCEEKGRGLIGNNVRNFSMVLQEQRRLMMALYPILVTTFVY